ncbi:MAG: aquaporin [Actinomycetota bacterium]|nr:aquaporin [Actinomycetota bacterium]
MSPCPAIPCSRFALVSAVLIGGPSTGGAVNPVRALGPELVSGTFTAFWVYLLAPTLAGIAAAVLYDRVIGRGNAPAPEEEQQDWVALCQDNAHVVVDDGKGRATRCPSTKNKFSYS